MPNSPSVASTAADTNFRTCLAAREKDRSCRKAQSAVLVVLQDNHVGRRQAEGVAQRPVEGGQVRALPEEDVQDDGVGLLLGVEELLDLVVEPCLLYTSDAADE